MTDFFQTFYSMQILERTYKILRCVLLFTVVDVLTLLFLGLI